MAIPQTRYVEINSGVSGAPAAVRRELIARVLTTNAKVPSAGILEFANATEVGSYFGGTSAEYKWASRYFGFVSKSFKSPRKISFARYADSNIAASVIGTKAPASVEDIVSDETLALMLSVNGEEAFLDNIDVSGSTSYADIVSAINSSASDLGVAVTATYSNGVFSVISGDATITSLKTTNDWGKLGLAPSDNPIVNAKVDAETPAEAIGRSAEISDNFASFAFIPTLTTSQIGLVAAWTAGQNYKYLYCVPGTSATISDIAAAVNGFSGVWAQLVPADSKDEAMPAAIAAATNYDGINTTQNYMFQQFGGAIATVTTTADADLYDGKRVNYYGLTQRAGRQLAFLQRGILADGLDAGVYVNEIWLKDALQTDLLNLLVGNAKVPANIEGEAMVAGALQGAIEQALANGTIMPNKTLTDAQKVAVDNITGVSGAWFAVQDTGYKLKVTISLDATTNEYKANYLLVYSKGDSIRKIEGTDVLI